MKKTLLNLIIILFTQFTISQTNHTINAGNFYFSPSSLTINQGDIVTWINDGGFHDVIKIDVNIYKPANDQNDDRGHLYHHVRCGMESISLALTDDHG